MGSTPPPPGERPLGNEQHFKGRNKTIARRTVLVEVLSNLEVFYIVKVQDAWLSSDQGLLLKKERRREGLITS